MFKSCSNNGWSEREKNINFNFRRNLVAHAGQVIKNTIYHKNRK